MKYNGSKIIFAFLSLASVLPEAEARPRKEPLLLLQRARYSTRPPYQDQFYSRQTSLRSNKPLQIKRFYSQDHSPSLSETVSTLVSEKLRERGEQVGISSRDSLDSEYVKLVKALQNKVLSVPEGKKILSPSSSLEECIKYIKSNYLTKSSEKKNMDLTFLKDPLIEYVTITKEIAKSLKSGKIHNLKRDFHFKESFNGLSLNLNEAIKNYLLKPLQLSQSEIDELLLIRYNIAVLNVAIVIAYLHLSPKRWV